METVLTVLAALTIMGVCFLFGAWCERRFGCGKILRARDPS
jgi:hypothetical protein